MDIDKTIDNKANKLQGASADMNMRLRKAKQAGTKPSSNCWSRSNSTPTTGIGTGRSVHGHGPSHAQIAGTATATTPQQSHGIGGSQARARITKNHTHSHSRPRPRTRHTTSSNRAYTYTASSFSSPHPSQQWQQGHLPPQPRRSISSRCEHFLSTLRRKLHLLKFSFLLQVGRWRSWLSAKVGGRGYREWLKSHVLRMKTAQSTRPTFGRGGDAHWRQNETKARKTGGGDEEKTGKIRRLSQSTVKSLKKACSLNSEKSELRAEDRRAMERLDELWRTREVYPVV